MTDLKMDMAKIQTLVGNAFSATGALVALSDGGVMSGPKLQQTLEKTAAEFEKAALELRVLCEKHSPGKGGYGRRPPDTLSARSTAMWRSWGTAGCTSGSIPSCPIAATRRPSG